MPLTLYTIGHSDRAPDEFIAHLKQHGIAVLVDVRSVPFTQANLSVGLGSLEQR